MSTVAHSAPHSRLLGVGEKKRNEEDAGPVTRLLFVYAF